MDRWQIVIELSESLDKDFWQIAMTFKKDLEMQDIHRTCQDRVDHGVTCIYVEYPETKSFE